MATIRALIGNLSRLYLRKLHTVSRETKGAATGAGNVTNVTIVIVDHGVETGGAQCLQNGRL
jgi:hypothetical protein